MKYQRARNLSEADVASIVAIISGWEGQLTWPAVISAVKKKMRQDYTRQALYAHDLIAQAWRGRKEALAIKPVSNEKPRSEEQKRIAELEAEVARLNKQIEDYKDMFARWAYNAHLKKITEEELSEPLLQVYRDPTQERRKPQRPRLVKSKAPGEKK